MARQGSGAWLVEEAEREGDGSPTRDAAMTGRDEVPLGVVIPALNEEARLGGLLDDIASLDLRKRVVVADGGSTDRTRAVARARGTLVVRAPRGRAAQMNAGAAALPRTPWLLFLHADSRLGPGTGEALASWLREASPGAAGVFRFRLRGRRWVWRVMETGQRLRERVARLPYGDQGLLVSRSAYRSVGGYPELPIMEDVSMIRRLRSHGIRVRRLDPPILTSGRRYEREGAFRSWVRNTALVSLYGLGVPPARLARWYPPEPGPGSNGREPHGASAAPTTQGSAGTPTTREPPGDPTRGAPDDGDRTEVARAPAQPSSHLLVFAKAPVPGEVKTRLAGVLGEDGAAALYRAIGREVVEDLRDVAHRTEIHFSPADARAAVEEWLGTEGLAFRPQVEGDLGARLREAFRSAFARGGGRVAAVGTDAPGLSASLLEEAFRLLEDADVVLGPSTDGGYYLLAISRHRPELFRGIRWSTDEVLEATLERARTAGLTVALLSELRDVDRPEDLTALGLDGASAATEAGPAGAR